MRHDDDRRSEREGREIPAKPDKLFGTDPTFPSLVADQTARLAQFQAAYARENGPGNTRIDPRFNAVSYISDRGSSTYQSLQASVAKSLSHGLLLRAGYTWSHSIDNSSDYSPGQGATEFNFEQNQFDPGAERGDSDFNIRHRFTIPPPQAVAFRWLSGSHGDLS